jgi:hypothetical protein
MGSRPIMVATLLGASVGVPYVMSQSSQTPKAAPSSSVSRYPGTLASGVPTVPALLASQSQVAGGKGVATPAGNPRPVEGVRFHSLGEVFRFDVTKEWIYSYWPRKSTGLADPELFGVRVPLVTGTGLSDLAGSLTYSFNRENQVQHISFSGRTADTTQLIQFLTTTYKFERRDALAGEQLYQVGSDDHVQSELRTRPDPVLYSTSPHGSFAVALELERPGSERYLPPLPANLPIPPAPSAAAGNPANPAASAGQATNSTGQSSWWDSLRQSTYDKVRRATPAEDNQVQWKRWPN